jgi:hypothetical protein
MKSFGLLSIAAGAVMLGLSGAASAAPISSALPSLGTLSATEGSVEQVQYWRHRRCHWVKHCHRYGRCHWVRRCHH